MSPLDTVGFTPHICKGNRDEGCKVGEAWGKIGQGIFPLKTFLVDQKPDYRRAQYIIEQSRLNYGHGKNPDTTIPPDDRTLPPADDDPSDEDEPPDPSKVF